MGKRDSRQQLAYLPLAVWATFVVTVCPLLLVGFLRSEGVVTSVWLGIAIGVSVSFGASYAGAALWKTRAGSRDVLFSELMLWGWAQRWRAERRLSNATDVLGLRDGPRRGLSGENITHEQRAGLLTQLASGLEARDPYTYGHSRRVARHAANIGKRMGLSAAEVAKIRTAGVIHDVGKVSLSTMVLHKEDKLTDGEFELIKRHPVEGATMVAPLGDRELTELVRHHHERFDGTGYPGGLAGDAIPLGARILAVADTFDAITSTRAYRQAHSHREALAILKAEAGTQLDPEAVRAFCSCYSGTRPLAVWTILTNGPLRLVSGLGGGLSAAKAASTANVMLAAAATAAVGGAALGPLVQPPTRSHGNSINTAGAAPAAERRASLPAAADGRARPSTVRAGGRLEGPARGNAPGSWRGYLDGRGGGRNAHRRAQPGSAREQNEVGTNTASGKRTPSKDHSGKLRGSGRGKSTRSGGARERGKGHSKVRSGQPDAGREQRKDRDQRPPDEEERADIELPTVPREPKIDLPGGEKRARSRGEPPPGRVAP